MSKRRAGRPAGRDEVEILGHAAGGAPIAAAPEWEDQDYSDEARERNPIYRQVSGLPPLGEIALPKEPAKRRVTLHLDPEIVAFFETTAERTGARGWQTLINAVLRAYVEAQRQRESPTG